MLSLIQAQFPGKEKWPSQKDYKHLFITSQAVDATQLIPDWDFLLLNGSQQMLV